jgi:hypothetical protein
MEGGGLSGVDPQRYQVYLDFQKQLLIDRHAAYAAFDRAILTLSSGALGISVAFIGDTAERLSYIYLLYASWGLFITAILSILLSYMMSQWSFDLQMDHAEAYYIHGIEEAFSTPNKFSRWTAILNYVAVAAFTLGLIATALFVGINLEAKLD